jgi:hypothetical protein
MAAPPPQGLARAAVVACALLATAPLAHAQGWTPVGTMPGGYADALVCDASGRLWAGGPNGLWRSDDHGSNWSLVKADTLPAGYLPNVLDLATGATGALLAADANAGALLVSSDAGASWSTRTPVISGPFMLPVSVAIAPAGELYALRSLSSDSHTADGIYHSTDGGASWSLADLGGLYAEHLAELFVAPDGAVYAAEGNQKSTGPWNLFRSADQGVSWTPSQLDHAPFASWPGGRTLWADAAGHVVVGCVSGIAASGDAGVSWPYFSNPSGSAVSVFCSLVQDGQGALEATWCGYTSGVVRSTNFGQTWQNYSAGLPPGTYRVLTVGEGGELYTADMAGNVYRTSPTLASVAPPAAPAIACAIAPNPSRGVTELSLRLPAASAGAVEVCDVSGRRLGHWNVASAAGTAALRLETSTWSPGLYLVRVSAGASAASAKLLVTR